ncbi:MAG: hypothetical protein EA397_00775 [Deltaproteobacteria bacterium]|nr:MAG: hypothetical protein EA397_00775 [Deltaproteobacteria bacterium]
MTTMNATVALLEASLPLTTLALAQDQPDTIGGEQDSGDETPIEVDPGSEPATIILRVEGDRRKRAPLSQPILSVDPSRPQSGRSTARERHTS